MKLLRVGFSICVVAFVTGCPKYQPNVDFSKPSRFLSNLNEHIKREQLQYNCYRDHKQFSEPTAANPTGCGAPDSFPAGPAQAKVTRNELVEEALPFIDDAYTSFINDLEAGRSRANFVADVVELSTSGAIGFTNGQRAVKIMGIALTAFRGARRSADINFYKDQTTQILINKMDDNRAKVRQAILIQEKNEINDYPIGDAIRDIVAYYNAGTLIRAFTELSKDTAAQAKQSEEKVLELKGVYIATPPTPQQSKQAFDAFDVLRHLKDSLTKSETDKSQAVTKLQKIILVLESDKDIAPRLKVSSTETDGTKMLQGLISIRRDLFTNRDFLERINQAIIDNGN